jgi:hypothetical protein
MLPSPYTYCVALAPLVKLLLYLSKLPTYYNCLATRQKLNGLVGAH